MDDREKIDEFLKLVALEGHGYDSAADILQVNRKTLSRWESENKARYRQLASVRQIYRRKKFSTLSPRDFLTWVEATERKCHYCKVTESDIEFLISKKLIYTKRLTTRGRKLEIERRLPNESYDNSKNLVYCCYWCNNAKTDEFSEAEFTYIGQLIGNNWNNRLRQARESTENGD